MSRHDAEIRPETHALDALIRRTIDRVRRTAADPGADAMLFLGSWHQPFPALLVQDPVLEPVDKVVWMVVCQHGRAVGASAAFPSYARIAREANVASTSTVSRAIAVLRATRWLSLCARVRDAGGRFRGSVYALHDEPLPLADALHLDPEYMQFLSEARRHHHARVRRVADAVIQSIDEDIDAGRDVLAPESAMERRLEAVRAVRREGPRRYFSFSAQVLARLANRRTSTPLPGRDQNSKAVADRAPHGSPQKSKSVDAGSSSNKKTTTTTHSGDAQSTPPPAPLVYPSRLTANQRAVADRYLAGVPPERRQSVLDELEGRFRSEQQGARPVYDEMRYLYSLCREINAGRFQPNLALKVEAERARRAEEAALKARKAKEQAARRRRQQRDRTLAGGNPFSRLRQAIEGPSGRGAGGEGEPPRGPSEKITL